MSTLGGDAILIDAIASRPAASIAGRLFWATDTHVLYRDNATTWDIYDVNDAIAAKGDLLAGLAANSLGVLTVGTDGQVLVAASGQATGLNWAAPGSGSKGTFGITIDGGGSAITTGVKGYVRVPEAGTITKHTILADQAGSIVIDIWKDSFANYPPTVADTITASAKPTLSTDDEAEDATLTGWTTSITAGDIFGFNVDSATTVEFVTLILEYTKS